MPLASLVVPPRRYRWNFAAMGLDYSLFLAGLSFASLYGVLPLFVQHLSASNLALAALPAVRAAGLLPPLLVAGLTERLPRKKPFVLGWSLVERLPYLVLAVATPLLATTRPRALLWLCFAMLALNTVAAGIATPGWLDLLARMLPDDWRGRFFGLWAALGGLLGVGGGAAAAALLGRFGWVAGMALCFACAAACLAASYLCLALGREPPAVPAGRPRAHDGPAWRRWGGLLRDDRRLRWYLAALALLTSAGAATAFYIVDAKRTLGLTDGAASRYAIVLLAATTAGNLLWGYVGDHAGRQRVVLGAAGCTALAALLALASRETAWGIAGYAGVFALTGLAASGLQLALFTVIVDLAPPELRPTYVGLGNMTQAPFAFGAPLLAAMLADRGGYPPVFALAAGCALGGLLLARQGLGDLSWPLRPSGHHEAACR